jgi:predicted ABC-type sugar transport system permease subunit
MKNTNSDRPQLLETFPGERALDNGMSLKNVPDFIQDIVKGAILVLAVGLDVTRRRRN